jgi:hypothetical protein
LISIIFNHVVILSLLLNLVLIFIFKLEHLPFGLVRFFRLLHLHVLHGLRLLNRHLNCGLFLDAPLP